MSGASGLIGVALCAALRADGQRVLRLVRRPAASADEISWDAQRGVLEPDRLRGVDALVHLAGESIAAGRWTRRRRDAIRRSRVEGTRALLGSIATAEPSLRCVLCASAVGIYGDRGDEWLDEESPPGTGFLAGVCREWEQAGRAGAPAGTRCVNLRFGVVLTAEGGMLRKLLPAFRFGFGGPVGSGGQFLSWISLADAVGAIRHVWRADGVSGPVNVVSPEPVTSREFAWVLGRVLCRPAICRVPAWVLRLALGRLADEAILASARVQPAVLQRSGYVFEQPTLELALQQALRRDELTLRGR